MTFLPFFISLSSLYRRVLSNIDNPLIHQPFLRDIIRRHEAFFKLCPDVAFVVEKGEKRTAEREHQAHGDAAEEYCANKGGEKPPQVPAEERAETVEPEHAPAVARAAFLHEPRRWQSQDDAIDFLIRADIAAILQGRLIMLLVEPRVDDAAKNHAGTDSGQDAEAGNDDFFVANQPKS